MTHDPMDGRIDPDDPSHWGEDDDCNPISLNDDVKDLPVLATITLYDNGGGNTTGVFKFKDGTWATIGDMPDECLISLIVNTPQLAKWLEPIIC